MVQQSTALSLPSILLPWVAARPDEPALLTPPGEDRRILTWARLLGEVARVRDRFRRRGWSPATGSSSSRPRARSS